MERVNGRCCCTPRHSPSMVQAHPQPLNDAGLHKYCFSSDQPSSGNRTRILKLSLSLTVW